MNIDIIEESLLRVWRVCHAQVVQAIVSVTWILWPMSIDHSPRRDGGDIIIMKLSNCRPCPICYGFSWLLWYWWYISGFFFFILLSVIFRYFFQLPDQIEYFKQWLCIRLVIKLRIPPDNRVKHPNNFFVIGNSCYYFHPKCFHQDHWLSCCLNENSCLLYTGL